MANIKLVLDTRREKSDGTFNILFRITNFKKVYTINSGFSVSKKHWNAKKCCVNYHHPNHTLINLELSKSYFKLQESIILLKGDFSIEIIRASMLPGVIYNEAPLTFKSFSEKLINKLFDENRAGNAVVYRTASNKFLSFCNSDITFNEMTYEKLDDFKHHLIVSGLKQNSISNYFRTLRAIYNQAIKQNLIHRDSYPFGDIVIKTESTQKRAVSKQEINALINLKGQSNNCRIAKQYFLLSYYLRGMSFTDMAYLKPENFIEGRIYYKRRKTNKNYSIKVFPQARNIIHEFYNPDNKYLLPILPNNTKENSLQAKKYINQWIKTTNKYLKRQGITLNLSYPLTTYVSRYGFANVAKRLGYSNEIIAEALGHEYGNKVTNIYLDNFDNCVIDNMHFNIIS